MSKTRIALGILTTPAMYLTLVVLVVLYAAQPARAQQVNDFWCAPQTAVTTNGTGSPMVWGAGARGGWAAWWCPVMPPEGQPGGAWFRAYTWGGLYSYGWSKVPDAMGRVQANATDPGGQARAEVSALAASAANAVDACRQRMLRRDACVALRTANLGPAYPAPATAASAASMCGAVQNCDALPPPADTWRTPANGTGTLYAVVSGRRGAAIPGRTAPAGARCACATLDLTYTPVPGAPASHFCPLEAGPATEVTLCIKAAQ